MSVGVFQRLFLLWERFLPHIKPFSYHIKSFYYYLNVIEYQKDKGAL